MLNNFQRRFILRSEVKIYGYIRRSVRIKPLPEKATCNPGLIPEFLKQRFIGILLPLKIYYAVSIRFPGSSCSIVYAPVAIFSKSIGLLFNAEKFSFADNADPIALKVH